MTISLPSSRSLRFSSWSGLCVGAAFFLSTLVFGAHAVTDDDNGLETEFADVLNPDIKQGYMLRSDTWTGSLPQGESKPIAHQFFKGNEYHLYVRTAVPKAKVSVHIYDGDGNLAEKKSWQRESLGGAFSCAEIVPKYTGRYFLIVKVEESTESSTDWEMAYAYK